MKPYEVIEHTADIGLRAYGQDLKQLFINAACGMFDILADAKNVQAKVRLQIKKEAPNIEELFLSWLSELLYQYNGKGLIFKDFHIDKLNEKMFSAEAGGETIDSSKHRLKTEIKAVTYHQLKVEKVKDIWQAEVIFDV